MRVQSTFSPLDFFVFRTPLLPFDEFLRWGDDLQACSELDDDLARFESAFASDRARLRDRLRAALTRPEARDALFIASPNIIERFHLWTDDPESERGRKLEHVLVRYFARMTGRATPFGLFAGTSVGAIGEETRLALEGRVNYQRHTRLDMDYLFALTEALGRDPALRNIFIYRPNSGLYRAAGRVRYVEARLNDKARSYHLVAAEETEYLLATLDRAQEGATLATLADALVDDETRLDEAEEYIGALIESQMLVPEITPLVTGPEPIHPLIDQLRRHEETLETAKTLEGARAKLAEIDNAGLGVEPERYRSVARSLESLPAKVELSRLFQVDMTKPAPAATLGGAVLDEMMRGVDVLHRLAQRQRAPELARFREAFTARYEQREVPLVEALDEEIGIGFGAGEDTSPLLNGLLFPIEEEAVRADQTRQTILLKKLCEALEHGSREIAFEKKELETISAEAPKPLPDCFTVTATLSARSPEALAQGDFRLHVRGIIGPSGAQLFGRFCHADETLRQHVRSYLRVEESFQPDAVFAEIAHLPEGRIGNVILRPLLRDYEIPYLGRSGVSCERQIPITDLHVTVRGERIRLRSARTGREVIPRLTNAHNYSRQGLGIYKFLCALQYQGSGIGLGWDWGAMRDAPFLPRVTTGRLVLSLARWRVSKEELRELGERRGAERFRTAQAWRARRRLPRLVALADGDNTLPIDFDNALSVESFIHLVKEREVAVLEELFPASDHLCAHGPEGAFAHELIVPFVKTKTEGENTKNEKSVKIQLESPRFQSPFPRRFPPGSEWLYAKLYTGTTTADYALREVVRPLVEKAVGSGAADRWFFLRYGDPDWHLRLRFNGSPERLREEIMPALHAAAAPLLDDGRLWRVQLDTYEREVERYGGAEGILLAERFFHADSEAALDVVEMLEPGDAGADERWRLTLYGIDVLLTDFGYDAEYKLRLLKSARENLTREFQGGNRLMSQLSEKYRKEREGLKGLLAPDRDAEHPLSEGFDAFARRSARLEPVVAELKAREREGRLSVSLPELMLSYTHMHANRLLRSVQRRQELVIYDLLTRHYESRLARDRSPR